jgi:hypothetical protein
MQRRNTLEDQEGDWLSYVERASLIACFRIAERNGFGSSGPKISPTSRSWISYRFTGEGCHESPKGTLGVPLALPPATLSPAFAFGVFHQLVNVLPRHAIGFHHGLSGRAFEDRG